jgi:lysophospholipid acyltransferase (LPLAT)-like uncharacterized protein
MSADSPQPKLPRRRSGVVVPREATFSHRLLARSIWLAVRTVDATLRWRLVDPEDAFHRVVLAGPVIFAIWHNRLALSLMTYRRYVVRHQSHRHMAAMVSASRDGGMLAHALKLFHVQPVRGSSSRRGAQALLEMQRLAGQGWDLAITPDGPRGPRYHLQSGVIGVASATGLPVVPACLDISRKKVLHTWDRFQIPLPFARITIRVAPVLRVPRHPDADTQERLRAELEARLRSVTND